MVRSLKPRRGDRADASGSVGFKNKVNGRGERLIWLERSEVSKLRAMRGPGESYSNVILGWLRSTRWRAFSQT